MYGFIPRFKSFSMPGLTQTAATAIVRGIPPYPGNGGVKPLQYAYTGGLGLGLGTDNGWLTGVNAAVTHVDRCNYLCGSTAHLVTFLQPKNFTTVASAAAINQAVINISDDPGLYATTYKYPLNSTVGTVANNAIAAADYCAYQLTDGTWIFDTVSSVSTLAITMTTSVPNITGGGVSAGALFFFFGVAADKNPATGMIDPQWTTVVSVVDATTDGGAADGIVQANHPGDPMIFVSNNVTAAGILMNIPGFYGKF